MNQFSLKRFSGEKPKRYKVILTKKPLHIIYTVAYSKEEIKNEFPQAIEVIEK